MWKCWIGRYIFSLHVTETPTKQRHYKLGVLFFTWNKESGSTKSGAGTQAPSFFQPSHVAFLFKIVNSRSQSSCSTSNIHICIPGRKQTTKGKLTHTTWVYLHLKKWFWKPPCFQTSHGQNCAAQSLLAAREPGKSSCFRWIHCQMKQNQAVQCRGWIQPTEPAGLV